MTSKIDARLTELGIELSAPGEPAGNYLPFVLTGNLLFMSGQVPIEHGVRKYIGKLGREISVAEGQKAAALCVVNLLAKLKIACGGDLDRVRRCVKVVGFVNSAPEFCEQPKVINGASDLLVSVFGDAGRHARSAVGMGSLPSGVAVEIEAVFEIVT
ncbi:endoribonuclease [Bradyrhizobium sp. LTSP885]|uniref:RidA family protein n=1 Tax=Bradyrhizobium sp. LTSP885 TaxID=1619232 RepID=UPI0005C8D968|nr:RidA family protein [Bradyrhizobium sp. LTSP885]KJC50467.1 endoribonuclease [Bradyrhizobium sp. LTSP885]